MKSTLLIKFFLLCLVIFSMHCSSFAQPSDPQNGTPDVPITGIEILIGAGALIGARKIARLRRKN